MLLFQRDASGLYLATAPGSATVAFLFQAAGRTDPTFQLTPQSWTDPQSLGFLAFFAPSTNRDWSAFAVGVRAAFTQNPGAQIGWFPEPLTLAPTLILVDGQGTSAPALSQPFSLAFRQSMTFQALPDQFGGATTVLFDDPTSSIVIAAPQFFQLTLTPPSGGSQTYQSAATSMALPLAGPLAGAATLTFALDEAALTQLEAGMIYFAPVPGSLVEALRYPAFRAPAGTNAPFNLSLSLDVLAPLDPNRTFLQFTDPLIGSYFVSATGKPFALQCVGGPDIGKASRLVLASRPVSGPTDAGFYYLTPAGQFGLALDGAGATSEATAAPTVAQLLCGVTGTEYLRVGLGSQPDALEFVPGQAAWRLPVDPASTAPVYLDESATTAWAQVVTTSGAYVAQPERSPLFSQPSALAADAAPSGLQLYLLAFNPTDAWRPSEGAAPPTPLVPYAGLNFATDPNLDLARYREMESGALNPTRAATFTPAPAAHQRWTRALTDTLTKPAMTPQGMVVQLKGELQTWDSLQIAISGAVPPTLQFDSMGPSIQRAVQKNQIFTVISADPAGIDPLSKAPPLFVFDNRFIEIGDWTFDLSPAGQRAPDDAETPPIFLMKFYPDKSIEQLVNLPNLWSEPDTFNAETFTATQAKDYLTQLIADARDAVYPNGPDNPPDETSLYFNFYQTVTDPKFSGILAVNCNMQLELLPPAIRAVLGGMKDPGIKGFRVHHIGVAINDTDPTKPSPALSKSAMFGLVDYEGTPTTPAQPYDFEVEYLRALFLNSELRSFACQVNLTLDNLFDVEVTLQPGTAPEVGKNVIPIMGSYQANSTAGDTGSGGEGVYSFVAQGDFSFDFGTNSYLKSIALTKLQFSFDQEGTGQQVHCKDYTAITSPISAHFGIWGSITFNDLKVLDVFSFEQLAFSNLGIDVAFDLTTYVADKGATPTLPQPSTGPASLTFAPGDLRLDLANSPPRESGSSLLKLLPFKLKSFLYSEHADQTIESLNYYSLGSIPGLAENGIALSDTFNYALLFDLDLGSMGGLVGSLSAFRFSLLIGWKAGEGGGIAFGVQLPQVNGKLEIKIEGVLTISIEQFNLEYATDSTPKMLVLGMHNCYIEILGKRLPPEGTISIGLFAPTEGANEIGWIGAYNKGQDGGGGGEESGGDAPKLLAAAGGGAGKAFDLDYLGVGQRVGPDPANPPADFETFLTYMQGAFWDALKDKKYSEIYHPDGRWIILTHFTLLEKIELGFVFYDVTPFYSLLLKITLGSAKGFSFEITYTKVSDTIGLFAAKIALPETLRTFQAGAASVTLPNIGIDIYTNGNWKVDLGYPDGDNWSVCFRVEAMAGPVPVTGSGGFYIASLSSATDPGVFQGTYASILAFGLAVRLGVGKDFTAGPLKAGVSVTFFGIIQGAAGYLTGGASDIFREPDALSLQGQFGIIGELYGSLDFVIIKASVNVRLEASIGIVLLLEAETGGSILLYIEASVSVSVSVEIDLFLFSITISFSFDASFRFEWPLVKSGSTSSMKALFVAEARALRLTFAPLQLALCPGLSADLPLMFLPELTVVFADAGSVGAPWFVASLGVPYDNAPSKTPTYTDFQPFEAVTTQLATFALVHALGLPAYNAPVWLDSDPASNRLGLKDLDSEPDLLTGWLDYPTLLGQLALFKGSVTVPQGTAGQTFFAAAFPMLPFLELATSGRLDEAGNPANLIYQFLQQNPVPASYLKTVDDYFNQLFVNRTSDSSHARLLAARAFDDATTPLIQEIFLDYFKGLIRGAVHELLVTLQHADTASSPLDALFMGAVGAQRIKALAGQMSSVSRGGVRLPYVAGLTVPGGAALPTTNPLYALLWQEFPVGGFANKASYTITLSNPDGTQAWLKADAAFTLTNDAHGVAPFQNLHESDVAKPNAPTAMDLTQTGPQSFPFQNAIVWMRPAPAKALSLRPFPTNLARLQGTEGGAIAALVMSRPTGGAYLADGTLLAAADITFATAISLTAKQIPGAATGSALNDVFALSGASQADEALLGQILAVLKPPSDARPIASIDMLYPPAPGTAGLASAAVNLDDVFVLRTNTTSVSQPPQGLLAMAAAAPSGVAVGANLNLSSDGGYGFLQIIQQAIVTNAPGYDLRYVDAAGKFLDPNLFAKGPLTLTLLVTYKPGSGTNQKGSPLAIEPYYNAVVLGGAQPGLLYYAETTDPTLATRYVALAAGTAGVELTRPNAVMHLKPTPALAAATGTEPRHRHTRREVIASLHSAGVSDPDRIRQLLVEAGSAPASLNQRYSLVSYQIQASAGFVASNLSAPVQPQQKPNSNDPTRSYRIVAPLYNVAAANVGVATPDRYASIGDPFNIAFFVTDSFGNQLPTPLTYPGTNLYFDPLIPLDQWQGIVPSYDFADPQPNQLSLHLKPSAAAFDGMSADQKAAALTHYQAIEDQITGPGVSFFIETNLALQSDGVSLAALPLSGPQAQAVTDLVGAVIAWLSGASTVFPARIDLAVAVSGPGTLPPLFDIAVLFGIERDPNLIVHDLAAIFPPAQSVATPIVPAASGSSAIGAFAADFAEAFPALKLAIGMNGGAASPSQTKARRARGRLKAQGLAGDGTGGARAGEQSIWAVAKSLLDISIGTGAQAGPRFASPKPLSNTLNSATVPLPALKPPLAPLPGQRSLVDVDLDQFNRVFFQAVDNLLSPASAAKAFELDPAAYTAIATGRETLAQKYAQFEVDWLFDPASPFSGTAAQLKSARDAFEQQMRATLMTAYAVDTIVQYDVAWNSAVSPAADGMIELFGQIEATLAGKYAWSGTTVTATMAAASGLSAGDRVSMVFTPGAGQAAPADGAYAVVSATGTTFTLDVATSGTGSGTFTATRQNAGLSTAHVGVSSTGPSPLTFLYGTPDVADVAIASFDLRYSVTNLQVFLAPDSGTPGEARPSIWLQLVETLRPHVGPAGAATDIPLVFRQFPTPPTLVSQAWAPFTPKSGSGNPIADAADWSYIFTYQAVLAAQDQINSAITYNTDLRPPSSGNRAKALLGGSDGPYDLFTALARFFAVYGIIQPILPNLADPDWGAALTAFSSCVGEVTQNTDWQTSFRAAARQQLAKVTDTYVTTDEVSPAENTTRLITLAWPSTQGQSSFSNVTLSIQALDPTSPNFPLPSSAYPGQGPITPTQPDSSLFQVQNVPPAPPGQPALVTHRVEIDALNVLAAENAIAAVQIERNLIALAGPDGKIWDVVPEFVYMTAQIRPSQPITPFIENVPPPFIDVTSLPNQGTGAACPVSPASLCQRVYTIMRDLLADTVQGSSLLGAHAAAGVSTGTARRLKVGCSYAFALPAVAGGSDTSISPLVPVVLARSFDIDGHDPAQLGDFASLFAAAVTRWAADNAILFGPNAVPAGAALIFDITLYAGLSGVNTPVLRFDNLRLKLTDIDGA